GTQPTFKQSPPINARSMIAAFAPSSPAPPALTNPAAPAPIATRLYLPAGVGLTWPGGWQFSITRRSCGSSVNSRRSIAFASLRSSIFFTSFVPPGRSSLNDTLFYPKARKGRDNLLARRLNSSYHQSVFPSDCGFNGGRYALPELRNRSFGKTKILPRVWIESRALCAITRGTAT